LRRAAAGASLRLRTEPLKALVEAFLDTWDFDAGDPARIKRRNEWVEMLFDAKRKTTLPDLLDETERRYKELDWIKPSAFLLYVDQGEELYVRAEEHQRRRFSEAIAQGVADPRLYMPRSRMRQSSVAGASCTIGSLLSASFSPGELGSKRLAAHGRQRRMG
jgi:hypothetical protein